MERSGGRGRAGKRSRSRRGGLLGQIKVAALIVAVCAAGALFLAVFQNFSFSKLANFVLFGSTDPYLSPSREREIRNEFGEIIQKEFGGKLK